MTGSDKQVAWAEKIIADKVHALEVMIKSCEQTREAFGAYVQGDEKRVEMASNAICELRAQDDATHIINRVRNENHVQQIDYAVQGIIRRDEI